MKCNEKFVSATLVAPLAGVSDTSETAVSTTLQQLIKNEWQPLAFFSKKILVIESKYRAYDSELAVND